MRQAMLPRKRAGIIKKRLYTASLRSPMRAASEIPRGTRARFMIRAGRSNAKLIQLLLQNLPPCCLLGPTPSNTSSNSGVLIPRCGVGSKGSVAFGDMPKLSERIALAIQRADTETGPVSIIAATLTPCLPGLLRFRFLDRRIAGYPIGCCSRSFCSF